MRRLFIVVAVAVVVSSLVFLILLRRAAETEPTPCAQAHARLATAEAATSKVPTARLEVDQALSDIRRYC